MTRTKGESVDIAFDAIRRMIRHYKLRPSQQVSAADLAETLGMSRTPVREAINRLMDYGLAEREGAHMVVKPIRMVDVVEILQVREAVESMAVRVIIQNGPLSEAQLSALNAAQGELSKSVQAGDLETNYKNDGEFHRQLVLCSGNTRLLDVRDRMEIQSERLRWLTSLTPNRYDGTCKEHQNIMECIVALDYRTAADSLHRHIQNTLQNYESILGSGKWEKIIHSFNELK